VAAGWPLAARAQQGERVRRIAALIGGSETDPEQRQRAAAFRQALRELGWIEGRNITIDGRYTAGEGARVQALARELIELRYEVILAATTTVVAALREGTRTIPIVFVVVSDPVGGGFVESLPRPGGNVTGFTNIKGSLGGKWLGLLKEIVPNITRVAMMFNPESAPQSDYYLRPFQSAARSLGVKPITAHVRNGTEIEEAMVARKAKLTLHSSSRTGCLSVKRRQRTKPSVTKKTVASRCF
jgi:putative tryptophan/tyrosine transport system substrate-binding protein